MPAGFDTSMASERLRDRDLTAGLRSLKLTAGMRPSNGLARLVLVRGGGEHPWWSAGLGFKDMRTALVIIFANLEDLMTIDEALESSLERRAPLRSPRAIFHPQILAVIGD